MFSSLEDGFLTDGISIDDQVSLDGVTWQDIGSTVFNNPTTLVNGPVYFRSIVTNTGADALTGVSLSDTNGEKLGTTTLTGGQVVTSSTVSIAAFTEIRQVRHD